jgi:hypothetical protein
MNHCGKIFLYIYIFFHSASEHAFKGILTSLPKSGGGEFGKFYSLPALKDPRIGMYIKFIILR